MQAFRTYIDANISAPVSDADFAHICAAFAPKRLKKRSFLLRAGEVCKHFAFVLKGALRMYSVDNKGIEHVLSLGVENWWVGDRESCVLLTPSRYYIDALEDASLLLITHTQMQELLRTVPAMAELMRGLDQRHETATRRRLEAAISCTAEERYVAFLAQHPRYVQRFPQHLIASYLGILPETLSRIRTKLHAKHQSTELLS
ncbi:Crp/Fnr family transcriptional regulator [Hymenobacter wooponensis]|uniref:Crp/Fnr family transcriptional regulator n=1 Tax=Hymenobacter wooponensis TaxID=1525360 RepID=A0A4Z0MDF3_9BACT|nr:Crp/Fnr family transcriptional regulator [Hymenobacter wooponensis]TGD77541.1 Crp/Fnr family transcriptional regulator [Hymenobacter wooponensis]